MTKFNNSTKYKKKSYKEVAQEKKEKLNSFIEDRKKFLLDMVNNNIEKKLPIWSTGVVLNKNINPVSKTFYKIHNNIALGSQQYLRTVCNETDKEHPLAGLPFYMTFKQAKDNDLNVKKGSSAYNIIKLFSMKVDEKEIEDEKTGTVETVDVFARKSSLDNVFHISDIENSKEPGVLPPKIQHYIDICFNPPEKNQLSLLIDSLIESSPCDVVRTSFFKGQSSSGAFYDGSFDKVNVVPSSMFTSQLEEFSTIAHEVSHSWGVESRYNRESYKRYSKSKIARGEEEIVANVSAQAVMSYFNINIGEEELIKNFNKNHDTYDFGWFSKIAKDEELILRAFKNAEITSNKIINDIESNLLLKLKNNPDLDIPEFLKERLEIKLNEINEVNENKINKKEGFKI
ncbi:DUF1738 domain-containing protein [Tatumella sp. JGM130]|uniref:zincin-like metallopeptidase domain-containing protein n=1 Tax=Tatumella sp. JGM130 TaxID=2799797 RepID=UPI001BB069EE|nr:zincin-like metallopeptidase domain-containing protein [Tatumella sp. JGM130]MBS0895229.1 DUF1738 domain-containing protein [Tatumella sp. JGM130]